MPVTEDRAIAWDGEHYIRGAPIRQWRCLNGHSITCNPYTAALPETPRFNRCAVCGGAITDRRFLRHPKCRDEYERRRRTGRRVPRALS